MPLFCHDDCRPTRGHTRHGASSTSPVLVPSSTPWSYIRLARRGLPVEHCRYASVHSASRSCYATSDQPCRHVTRLRRGRVLHERPRATSPTSSTTKHSRACPQVSVHSDRCVRFHIVQPVWNRRCWSAMRGMHRNIYIHGSSNGSPPRRLPLTVPRMRSCTEQQTWIICMHTP